jgi:predicted enzyme related to lactoylglutathione lyase
MSTRSSTPAGAPCWADLLTSDPGRIRAFYGDVLGWQAEEPNSDFGGYFNFTRNGVRVAGCMPSNPDMGGVPDTWSVYLASDDADKTLEMASANGAQVVVPAMAVGDLGVMAVLVDPGGASIGIWQPRSFPGVTVLGEQGAPGWFELHTRDYDTVLDFYRTVFHWQTDVMGDDPGFRYSTLRDPSGEGQLAGVMDASGFLPEGVPAHWSVYWWVDDADDAAAKVVAGGGSVRLAPEDTPYGRLATVADPAGAQFKLMAANEAMPATS